MAQRLQARRHGAGSGHARQYGVQRHHVACQRPSRTHTVAAALSLLQRLSRMDALEQNSPGDPVEPLRAPRPTPHASAPHPRPAAEPSPNTKSDAVPMRGFSPMKQWLYSWSNPAQAVWGQEERLRQVRTSVTQPLWWQSRGSCVPPAEAIGGGCRIRQVYSSKYRQYQQYDPELNSCQLTH